jgi:endoglucanase
VTDLASGARKQALADPGYRIVAALAVCAARGTPVPDALKSFVPTAYYPSTLHLLALSHLAEHEGACR